MPEPKGKVVITDAVEILERMFIRGNPEAEASMEEYYADAEVSRLVYDMREAAGMSQAQLARAVGTSQSSISRLEDADYDGHSLGMLRRIAKATGHVVELSARPIAGPTPKVKKRSVAPRSRNGAGK